MPQIGEIAWHVTGDIGGTGVSRFRFSRQDAGPLTGTDVNAAAAASRVIYSGTTTWIPSGITWSCQPVCNIYDSATGLVQPPLAVGTVPGNVTGSGSTSWPAGVGARINWKTSATVGRRLLRGATFFVPLSNNAYGNNGAVISAVTGLLNTQAGAYLTQMTTALLYPLIWHRPAKGVHSGGVTGIVYAGTASATPAGLRSRRA